MSVASSVSVREATSREATEWDSIVKRFPNHRITHLTPWINSLVDAGIGKPLLLVTERDGDIVACTPGLLTRLGPLRLFGSPLPGWQTLGMGPAFDPSRIGSHELVSGVVSYVERKHGVHHIEMVSNSLAVNDMESLGFREELLISLVAPMNPHDVQGTFKAMKDSAKRNIKRAEKKLGLLVRFEDDEDFVQEHYDQITEVFARGGNVVPFGMTRFRAFMDRMRDAGSLVALSVLLPDNETRIATGTFTIASDELVLWMWAHRTAYRWHRPSELLTWSAMKKGMEAGCTSVDFMGRGDFKAVFGATPNLDKHRWVRSRFPVLVQARDLAQRGYRWQQAARGRLARMRYEMAGAFRPEVEGGAGAGGGTAESSGSSGTAAAIDGGQDGSRASG
ncbi:MAG TPA: GNAT family N-acetyltransferase [Gemmatimonadales bacterium]|nr:GNAT family N-acetyltransferase [Gemmatimonadales bacterium]